jgi:hypothetical protein
MARTLKAQRGRESTPVAADLEETQVFNIFKVKY